MLKPRVKRVSPPMPLEVGTDRHVWYLLRLMDGSRTTEQICAAMRDKDPRLADEDVRAMLDQLIGAGYVEDAALQDSVASQAFEVFRSVEDFEVAELERYRRKVELFGFFNRPPLSGHDYRLRLRHSRVTVLGVAGLGSYAALALAAAGVGDLLLVDGDDVEEQGLERQILYSAADAGKPRAEAAAARLRLIHPEVVVSTRSHRLSNPDEARECLRGRNLLVCAAGRQTYSLINEAALKEDVPWLRAADDGLTVSMFLHVPRQTACFECGRAGEWAPVPGHLLDPCAAPISGVVGSLAALEAVKLLSGAIEPAALNRRLILDLQSMDIRFQEAVRDADCPMCSG